MPPSRWRARRTSASPACTPSARPRAQELDDATGALRAAEARAAGAAARAQAAVSGVESARAASEAAGTTESFARITAPFDGVVTEKMVEPGNMAAPGTPLMRVEDTRGFRLDVRVDESRIGQISPGATVPVSLDSGADGATTTVSGTVAEIGRAVDADARAFLVKIALPDSSGSALGDVRPGALQRPAAARPDGACGRARAPRADDVGLRRREGHRARQARERERDRGAGRPVRGRRRDRRAASHGDRRPPRHGGRPLMAAPYGAAGRLAAAFINSKLTPLFIVASMALGALAVVALPREEEPQIIVPMVDVFVEMPGATPADVEQRVTRPMEQLLWEVPGVEYVYSTSSAGQSMVVVRFKVGEAEEAALVRLNQKLAANADRIPPGVVGPIVKPRSIDDVPILAVTVWSARYGDDQLRALAAQLRDAIAEVTDVSEVTLIGGRPRQLRVDVDPARLAAYGLDPLAVQRAIGATNARGAASGPVAGGQITGLEAGNRLRTADDVRRVVVSAVERPSRARERSGRGRGRRCRAHVVRHLSITRGRRPCRRSRSPWPSARAPTPSTSRIA